MLTQLDVADPDALFGLFEDLLKINPSEATGAAGHQHRHHAHKLGPFRHLLLLRGPKGFRGPLDIGHTKTHTLALKQFRH